MSYNTIAGAKELVGVDLSQALLNVAQAKIHEYTDFRWDETEITETFSGDGEKYIFLRYPIISISSLVIDDETLVEDTNFEIRHNTGMVRVYRTAYFGHDNISITYKYGFTPAHNRYAQTLPIVQFAEAQLALLLKKNPLNISSINVAGTSLPFGTDPVGKILAPVPRPLGFGAV